MQDGKCKDCGRELRPLVFSWYCPNDCDRKAVEVEAGTVDLDPKEWDDQVTPVMKPSQSGGPYPGTPITLPPGVLNTDEDQSDGDDPNWMHEFLKGIFCGGNCPTCSSSKVSPFPLGPPGKTSHCWDCGHVW